MAPGSGASVRDGVAKGRYVNTIAVSTLPEGGEAGFANDFGMPLIPEIQVE